MNNLVLDSSVLAKCVLPEADSAHAQRVVGSGGGHVILDIAYAEVANAIWRRHHQRLITANQATGFLREMLRMPVHSEPAVRLLAAAMDIALRYDRAIYDALFVALARDLRTTGVTADEPLWRAVSRDFPEILLLRNL